MSRTSTPVKGFTLVELALTMVIIGLLIAGVLKGSEMLQSSRIVSAVAQIKAYEVATRNFKNTYGALPGDIRAPEAKLPHCTSTECAASGNQDGKICGNNDATNDETAICGSENLFVTSDTGTALRSSIVMRPPAAHTNEAVSYWRHLIAANMIVGFDLYENMSALDQDASPYGSSMHRYGPESPFGSRYMVYYFNVPSSDASGEQPPFNAVRGHYLKLSGYTTHQGVTAAVAARLDAKMDDGVPNTGRFLIGDQFCVIENTPGIYGYGVNGQVWRAESIYINGPNCEFNVSIEN